MYAHRERTGSSVEEENERHKRSRSTCSSGHREEMNKGSRLGCSLDANLGARSQFLARNNQQQASTVLDSPRRSAPRSPDNFEFLVTPGHLAEGCGELTPAETAGCFRSITPNPFKPGTAWKNSFGMVDTDAAEACMELGLNIFGSNAEILMDQQALPPAIGISSLGTLGNAAVSSDEDLDPFGFDLALDEREEEMSEPCPTPVLLAPAAGSMGGHHQSLLQHLLGGEPQLDLKTRGCGQSAATAMQTLNSCS